MRNPNPPPHPPFLNGELRHKEANAFQRLLPRPLPLSSWKPRAQLHATSGLSPGSSSREYKHISIAFVRSGSLCVSSPLHIPIVSPQYFLLSYFFFLSPHPFFYLVISHGHYREQIAFAPSALGFNDCSLAAQGADN
eukprot:GHVT01092315.1.p1 GENE.GHVT01092315.1~~GHVT01092315.1.p1  ORF type:complete len:137 (-),score=2.81 GHVT01092315.1:752-1162(-)